MSAYEGVWDSERVGRQMWQALLVALGLTVGEIVHTGPASERQMGGQAGSVSATEAGFA